VGKVALSVAIQEQQIITPMEKTTTQLKSDRTTLSNVVVNSMGKLAYARPPLNKIVRLMLKDFPIMCWYMLIGMLLLFTRSLWAVMHPAITINSKADMLIYVFLSFVSSSVTAGLVGGSYYFAKSKLKSS
jgi:hypothetical protein